ncbi:hypothetical protein EMMF5_000014 [Cystobasidiomycetes sp. EMM_F5]
MLQTSMRHVIRSRAVTHRSVSTTSLRFSSHFGHRPAPPRLPPHLQKEFEELQRQASTPLATPTLSTTGVAASNVSSNQEMDLHPDLRSKPKAEFDGDVNPNTGEVGGPKNNPLNYEKEWTYGGRATDF